MLNLECVNPALQVQAREHISNGDADRFVFTATSNQDALALVFDNMRPLMDRGIYERALLIAFTGTRTNHSHWQEDVIDEWHEEFRYPPASRALRA